MKYSFSGVSTDNDTEKFLDHFEALYEDCGAFYSSKEVFRHEDDGLSFDYRYCVEIRDLEEYGDETGFTVELMLVPEFDSLCEKQKSSVLSCCCVDEDEVTAMDVAQYGDSVMFGYETVGNDGETPYDENQEVLDRLTAIANTYKATDRLRGFYLDKYVNRIGTTGWDMLDDFINGVDFVTATLDRYKTGTDDDE